MFQPNNHKMDYSTTFLNDLPPLKRLRLLQQQQQQKEEHHYYDSSSPLPAKKRKESRTLSPPSPTTTKTDYNYSLPAKKRVWALQPQSPASNDIVPAFDLNVEYTTSPNNLGDSEEDDSEEEDGVLCCVCQSTDGDPADPIVFCDGCDLMVHASCYGTPLSKSIPDGDWFCERCRFRFEKNNVGNINCNACALCPSTEGAMKRTTAEEEGGVSWAHVVCALFVPEVFFLDPEGREGIDFSKVPKKRWEERCYLCGLCEGCALVCSEPKCGMGFHVTCALKEELWIEYREGKKGGTIVAGFCKKHTQVWEKQQQSGKYKIVAVEDAK